MIKLIQPYIQFNEIEAEFKEIFSSGWFTKGPWVERFRQSLRDYIGVSTAFLTTSATTSLTMALRALSVSPGDEVVVADFSFPATANVVEDIGATPVFADVRPDTYTLDIDDLERKITSRTKTVIFVDALGNPAGVTRVKSFCDSVGLPLIEDSACGIGSSEHGVKVGAIADLSCFSFHPRKLLTTGEGGAIISNSETWNQFFEIKLNHGAVNTDNGFDFVDYGYNYRLPDLQCAMGVKQLQKTDAIITERQLIRDEYISRLASSGLVAQHIPDDVVHNVQSLVFTVPASVNRDGLIAFLRTNGVESTIGTYAMASLTYYRRKYNDPQEVSDRLFRTTVTLPCYHGVDVEYVTEKIREYCSG